MLVLAVLSEFEDQLRLRIELMSAGWKEDRNRRGGMGE